MIWIWLLSIGSFAFSVTAIGLNIWADRLDRQRLHYADLAREMLKNLASEEDASS